MLTAEAETERETLRTGSSLLGTLRSVGWYLVSNVSGQPIGPIFKGEAIQEKLVTNYKSTLRNIPEERKSHLQRGESQKSLITVTVVIV